MGDKHRVVSISRQRNLTRLARLIATAWDEAMPADFRKTPEAAEVRAAVIESFYKAAEAEGYVVTRQASYDD